MTKEELERNYKHIGDPSQAISHVKELIAAGRGHEHVRFVLTGRTENKTLEGAAVKVYDELVSLQKEQITGAIEKTAQTVEKLKWAFSAENRQLVADTDPITPQTEADVQAWLTDVARDAVEMRAKLVENQPEFSNELQELDSQIAEIASMVQEPFAEGLGAGKVRVLDEERHPHTEVWDLPMRDKIEIARLRDSGFGREKLEQLKDALGNLRKAKGEGDREAMQQLNAQSRQLLSALTGGQPLIKVIEELLDRDFPELMKAFYPRIYEQAGRYHSPRACAAMMANVVAEMLRYGFQRSATAYRLLMPGLAYLRERRMPMFFVAPDLLEAVLRTDFDDDINWTELELPYETGILMLPKGALVHPEDGEVAMLIWSRVGAGHHPGPWSGIPSQTLLSDAFVILGACMDKVIWYDSILTANVRPVMRLHNLFYREPGEPLPNVTKSSPLDSDLTEKDAEFLEKMGVIVFGTILAMNAKPQLIEHGKLIKRVGKGEKAREFWSPNVIGAKYKLRKETPRIDQDGQFVTAKREHGTHASPRMHWRRGHYREQPYGPKLKHRKTIWIEPILIGAEPQKGDQHKV